MSDEEIASLVADNQSYFVWLIKRYEIKLKAYILRITNIDMDEADDILQDVFIKVYENINDFDPQLKFSSWIYRIAHNTVISNHRKKQVRPEGNMVEVDDRSLNNIAGEINITKEMDQKLLRQNLNMFLDRLDPKYRDVLVLKYFEEKDYHEISDILKKPMGTIATLINRAKKQLREEIMNGDHDLRM